MTTIFVGYAGIKVLPRNDGFAVALGQVGRLEARDMKCVLKLYPSRPSICSTSNIHVMLIKLLALS